MNETKDDIKKDMYKLTPSQEKMLTDIMNDKFSKGAFQGMVFNQIESKCSEMDNDNYKFHSILTLKRALDFKILCNNIMIYNNKQVDVPMEEINVAREEKPVQENNDKPKTNWARKTSMSGI